jgi:uncharacterized lipoprotein YmbA
MPTRRFIYFLLLPCWLLLLAGCIGGKTPPSQFYLLEPIGDVPDSASGSAPKPLVALGPVRIPRYVDRPQIMTASGKNAYRLSELNRWAEPLGDNLSRVLAQNLSQLAAVDTVPANGSGRARQAPLRVSVNIQEFHVNPEGQAGLTARWQIARGEEMRLSRQAAYRSPASTTDYRMMVAGLNDCVNQLSRDLAAALRQILDSENPDAK